VNKQTFNRISASHKNALVKFAKRKEYTCEIDRQGRNLFNVVVYCSSEAMEDRRF